MYILCQHPLLIDITERWTQFLLVKSNSILHHHWWWNETKYLVQFLIFLALDKNNQNFKKNICFDM